MAMALIRRRWLRGAVSLLLLLAVVIGLMRTAAGAIVAGTAVGSSGNGVSTLSWSHTTASGTARLLVVRVANTNSTVSVSSVTYGGVALTQLSSAIDLWSTTASRASIYYLLSPNVGTATVTVTLSASARVVASSISFTGVSQSAPFGTIATATNNSTTPTVSLTGSSSDVFIDAVSARGNAGTTGTAGSGQAGYSGSTGSTSADVLGLFSIKAGASASNLSWSYGTPANWVSLGVPLKAAGPTVSGTVFEDVNYGGGAGRSLAASGGTGMSGATVELYSGAGSLTASTTTASDGSYSFTDLPQGSYFVRVVTGTLRSTRTGSIAGLLPVQTWRYEASWQTPAAVTNEVGGARPDVADSAAAPALSWSQCATEAGGSSNTCAFTGTRLVHFGNGSTWTTRIATGSVACSNAVFGDPTPGFTKTCEVLQPNLQSASSVYLGSSDVTGLDFGYNFNTVVNTNDSGAGSLRQTMTNANTLGGDGSLAQAGRTGGIEHLVFMVSNGTTGSGGSLGLTGGLRAANNFFTTSAGSYNVATIAPTSSLPIVTSPLVMDAQTQPGWSLAPLIEVNGAGAGTTSGLVLNGAGSILRGFVINRFSIEGVTSTAAVAGLVIQGNYIGTNAAGTAASPNANSGIWINQTGGGHLIGGTTAAQRNVLSGQTSFEGAAILGGSGNTIQGNYIGTNAAGTAAIPNGRWGIAFYSGVSNSTVGGTAAGAGNVVCGSGGTGISIDGTNITIQGNTIGLNAAGTAALPNTTRGVYLSGTATGVLIGGTAAGAGNVISGNGGVGVRVDGVGNTVQGNWIGTDGAGTSLFANGGGGVYSTANTVTIGGTATGAGNVVAGNTGVGILVAASASGNAIQGNSVYGNSGLGIDLGGDGASANDGVKTTGAANLLMDTPIISGASLNGTSLTVSGYVGSAANQSTFASARVEVFANDPASSTPSGKTYLGFVTANASGNFSGVITGVTGLTGGTSALTATATDASGNTSEFGTKLTVIGSAATLKAQWEFESFSANTTPDTSGNGNTLSLGASGVSQVTGLAGYGMNLNGAFPASGASTGAKLTTTSSYTVSAWVKYNGMSNCLAQSVVAQEGVTTHAFEIALVPNCGLPQPLYFEILAADVDSSSVKRVYSTFTPTTGTWYHVAGVYDASSSTMSFYINCALQGTLTGVTTYNASGSLVVGRSRFSASYRDALNGVLDTVRIWTGVRSASEISTECVDPSHTLRAEYRFEQASWNGTAGEVLDSTGNGYNGTAASLSSTKPTTANLTPAIAGSSGTCRYGVFNRANKDYVALPTTLPNLGSSSGFTGSAWIRTTDNTLIGQRILIDDENNAGFSQGWILSLGDRGAGMLNFTTRANPSGADLVTGSVIANNTWYFVAFGVDSASKTKFIRVLDTAGAQLSYVTQSYTEANIGADPGAMSIGGETNSAAYENTNTFGFAGNIDDVRIHDGALSQAEITVLWALRSTCSGSIDHVEIQHASGTGVTCTPTSVTVRACQDAACSSLYTGGLSGTLTASGAQASVNWPNGAGFSIASGSSSTTVSLQQTLAAGVVLGVTGLSQPAANATTCNFGSPACTFTAADSGLIFDVPSHRAEVLQSITVSAVRKSDNSLACVPAFANVNKTVAFYCGYSNPVSGSRAVRVGGVALNASNNSNAACDGSGASVSLAFNASGVASTTVQYADVGNINLTALHTSTLNGATLTMTGSDSFIAAPSSFSFSGITAAPIRAGNAFAATVSALNSAGAVTPNFGAETNPSSVTLTFAKRFPTGSGAATGTFSGSLGAFSNGVATASNLVWTEVGQADMSADLVSPGYLSTGMTVTGTTGNGGAVGPFIPDHFDVVATNACSPFTYAGQPFGVTITARNASNGTTANFDGSVATAPNFAKATTLSSVGYLDPGTWAGNSVAAGSFVAGVAGVSPSYAFNSKFATPQTLVVRASDTSGVSSQGYAEGSVALRSGRLRAFNRFGPNGVALSIPVQAEYWGGKAWVLNTADNCSVIPASAVSRVLYWDRLGAASAAWAGTDTGSAIVAGLGSLTIAAPPGSAFGSIDLALNLGSGSAADQSCLGSHVTATGANLPWLRSQQGSCASGWAADPSVRATFGVRAPETRKTVHVREVY